MLTVIKPPLIKDFSPVNSANTLPSPHHRPLLLQQSKIISAELHKKESSGNRLCFLDSGYRIQFHGMGRKITLFGRHLCI